MDPTISLNFFSSRQRFLGSFKILSFVQKPFYQPNTTHRMHHFVQYSPSKKPPSNRDWELVFSSPVSAVVREATQPGEPTPQSYLCLILLSVPHFLFFLFPVHTSTSNMSSTLCNAGEGFSAWAGVPPSPFPGRIPPLLH
jgi:hypothetical protein